jgi:methylenetetrahydrofolate dehydrogenase (NADP+)/methenyltetrahydrofolate cyclohydrolase
MNLIDGKAISEIIKQEIALEVAQLIKAGNKTPHLAAILVGHDGGSESYVSHKVKDCEEVGFNSTLLRFEDTITEDFLLQEIEKLNQNDDMDGFIVQLPLPKHFDEQKIINAIKPSKDVDGFHPINVGRMVLGLPCFISATPFGIVELLKHYKISTKGKNVVVLGRSNIVGRPLSILLSQKHEYGDATVTVAHSRTINLKEICLKADIIVAAMGQPEFLKGEMVKNGAVVIDVGTTRIANPNTKSGFKLTGDVKFDEVAPKCSWITPVPGGVGPMTRVGLLKNTLLAYKKEVYR